MDEGRRSLLRAIAVLGLAGCASIPPRDEAAAPGAAPSDALSPSAAPSAPRRGSTPAPAEASSEPVATPPPSPTTPTPTPAETARRVVLGRDVVGLPPARGGGRPHAITGLMLHHTAAPVVPPAQAPARFREIARFHQDAGFVDAAYHWGVDTGGNVYQLRDEAIAGETFTGYDPAGWLLVVCDGNFEESEPTAAMLDAVADVFTAGVVRYAVDPGSLVGHRDRAATACPGDNLQRRLPTLVGMIEERLDQGGVVLEVTSDARALP